MLSVAYGKGDSNFSGFRLQRFDELYEQVMGMPDGPARNKVLQDASLLLVAYVPFDVGVHRTRLDLSRRSVVGFRRPPFALDWWQYVDVDTAER